MKRFAQYSLMRAAYLDWLKNLIKFAIDSLRLQNTINRLKISFKLKPFPIKIGKTTKKHKCYMYSNSIEMYILQWKGEILYAIYAIQYAFSVTKFKINLICELFAIHDVQKCYIGHCCWHLKRKPSLRMTQSIWMCQSRTFFLLNCVRMVGEKYSFYIQLNI